MMEESLIPGLIGDLALECLLRIPYRSLPIAASSSPSWSHHILNPSFHRSRKISGLTRPILILSQSIIHGPTQSTPSKKNSPPTYCLVICEPEGPGSWVWRPMDLFPGSESGLLPMFCGVFGVGTEVVLIGGWDRETWEVTKAVHVFSFLTGNWRRRADYPGPARSIFGCAADGVKGRVLVAGGHDMEKNALKSAIVYDVAEDRWEGLPDLGRERDECRAVFHRGRFHVIGGYGTDAQGRFEDSEEVFDWSNWQWDQVDTSLLGSSSDGIATNGVTNEDGELYMCRDGYVARLDTEGWQNVAEVPADVCNVSCVMTWRDKMMLTGIGRSGGEAHKFYVLDLKRNKWEHLELPSEYCGHVQSGCTLEL